MNGHKVGDPQLVESHPTLTGDTIAVGDMLWQDASNSNAARPASAITWNTNLATTQADFKNAFLGVAVSAKPSGSTATVRVATRGEFEFDMASGTLALGSLMGPAKQSGNALENQKLAAAVVASSVCRSSKPVTTARTKVQVCIRSTLIHGAIT